MKTVINGPLNTSVMASSDTKEFSMYVLETGHSIYMLRMLPSLPGEKWSWLSLLRPKMFCGGVHNSFRQAMRVGIEAGNVFEIDGISDLIEFLKDREEEHIVKI